MSDEFVEGNLEDKYNASNPISKYLMKNFLNNFEEILSNVNSHRKIYSICEVGCGDGELLLILHKHFPKANLYATDLSTGEIKKAEEKCRKIDVSFSVQNAEDLNKYKDNQFDLVVCAEVLEHVVNPSSALSELARISRNFVLVSVPNEPIWRFLNMIRGKYLTNLGNTPGHLNHWNIISLTKFLVRKFKVIEERYPLPWQMKLLTKERK